MSTPRVSERDCSRCFRDWEEGLIEVKDETPT